jgi:hypothetical protein
MKPEYIYQKLKARSIARSHFFGRQLHVVTIADFKLFDAHFVSSYNLLNRQQNYRTKNLFRHIHAIQVGELVEFHYDYMNPDKGLSLVFLHTVTDVVPYFLYFIVTLQRPYTRMKQWAARRDTTYSAVSVDVL